MFTLPKGYQFAPSITEQTIGVPGEHLYGGADISDAFDAAGNHWVLCLAKGPDGVFKFRAFMAPRGTEVYAEKPIPVTVSGRGNGDIQWFDGNFHYSAFEGETFFQGVVPGFAAFPSIPALVARIAALEARVAVPVLTPRYKQALERLCIWLGIP